MSQTDLRSALAEERGGQIVAEARLVHPDRFPGSAFDDSAWDISAMRSRTTHSQAKYLSFTEYGSNHGRNPSPDLADAIPHRVSDLMKAYAVLSPSSKIREVGYSLLSARLFWSYLTEREPKRAAVFAWHHLTVDDLAGFEDWLVEAPIHKRPKKRLGSSIARGNLATPDDMLRRHGTSRGVGGRRAIMERLLRWTMWLQGTGLIGRIAYQIKTPDQRRLAKETPEGRKEAGERKLPPEEVLRALADIYWRLITAPRGEIPEGHLLLISLAVVQMLTGLRANEMLTMPADCERWQQVMRIHEGIAAVGPAIGAPLSDPAAEYRYGLVFYVEKARQKKKWIRWVSPTAEPIVRDAVARIKQLTEPARARARVLERSPDAVPLPEHLANRSELTRVEVLEVFGLQNYDGALRQGQFKRLRAEGRGWRSARQLYYRAEDVAALLQDLRDPQQYTLLHPDGTVQKLSESLCTIFQGFFVRSPRQQPRKTLVTKVMYATYHAFLAGGSANSHSRSVFETYGSSEEQREYRANSHAFRHWLTTVAFHGKMPIDRLTLYFARVHGEDTLDYIHPLRELSDEQVGDYISGEIEAGRVFGDVALTYWSLPADPASIRHDFLRTVVRVGHVTPWGLCIRDFAIEPCDKHIDCLNDCASFVAIKGDERQIEALKDLRWRTEELLRLAEGATAHGDDWGPGHAEHHRRRLAGIDAALAFHADPQVPLGSERHVFPVGPRSLPVLPNLPVQTSPPPSPPIDETVRGSNEQAT